MNSIVVVSIVSLVMMFTISGCGGGNGSVKVLDGNFTVTLVQTDKQTNTAKLHIVSTVEEALYVFSNNLRITLDSGTISDGYVTVKSGINNIKLCSDDKSNKCSYESKVLVSTSLNARVYKKYILENESAGLTTKGNKLIYGAENGNIYSLDLNSESSNYLYNTGSSLIGGLTFIKNNSFYFSQTFKGAIYKLDIDKGNHAKISSLPFPDGLDYYKSELYSVTNDRSGIITIMDREGKKIRTINTRISDLTGIAHSDNYLYVLSEDADIYQVNSKTGKSYRIFTNDNLFTEGNSNNGLEAITILNDKIYVSYIDDQSIYEININLKDYE
jgi:hypothetical protein